MPVHMIAGAVADGIAFGWFRIAWIVVAAVFVYDIAVESGQFEIIKQSRRTNVLPVSVSHARTWLSPPAPNTRPDSVTTRLLVVASVPMPVMPCAASAGSRP